MKTIGFLSFALLATPIVGCSTDTGRDLGPAQRSEPITSAAGGAADITTEDAKDFIHHVAIVNLAEIDLGRLALDHGAAAEVRKFAQMMIDDHTASADTLKTLALDLKVDVPGEIDAKHVEQRDKLTKRFGADFDRAYASAMIDGHKDLLEQLEPRIDKKGLDQWKVEMNGKTKARGSVAVLPDKSDNRTTMRINQFAASIYPTVHAHLEAAKALESSLEKRQTKR